MFSKNMGEGRNLVVFLFVLFVTKCLGERVVETSAGRFSGEEATDGDFYQFLGIPYGEVDAANPFGVAKPYPAIQNIYEANDDSRICPQILSDGSLIGSLDCLRMNVYVPTSATETSQLPVMVNIHGGYFSGGGATKNNNNPRFLVRHNVIVITIQYRLGPYGFMCLNRKAVPGNQGLKDQVLALKWIRDNIQAFGGNPNQVTLFGSSAGGHSIDLHLLSEQEKIFNNVILQTGSSLVSTVLYEPEREAPLKLAAHLGLVTVAEESNAEALSSLRNVDALDVVKAASELNIEFKPCAETKFDDVEPFITEFWIDSPVPKVQGVPVLIGFTEYERQMYHINKDSEHFQGLANMFYNYVNQTFEFDDERLSRMVDYAKRFYLGDDAISEEFVWPIINFESDYWYVHPIQRSIKKFIQSNAGNIFYYMFSYSGERSEASMAGLDLGRANHGDDRRYIFDASSYPQQISADDQVMIDKMTTMWTNFAKYSDPTPEVNNLLPTKWVPIDTTNDIFHYLKIDSEMTMERRPFNRRMAFWDLFYKLNGDYQRRFDAIERAEDDDDGNSGVMSTASCSLIFTLVMIAFRY